mgnify:CR=1 FL=1
MVDEEDSLFGSIILDISHKDLYTSFDEWLNFDIEDFRAPNVATIAIELRKLIFSYLISIKGELCKAEKSSWIVQAPDTLFFQLQRVVFNKDNGNRLGIKYANFQNSAGIEKLDDPFYFEKEIYIDRFLLEHKDIASKIKGQVKELKKRVRTSLLCMWFDQDISWQAWN